MKYLILILCLVLCGCVQRNRCEQECHFKKSKYLGDGRRTIEGGCLCKDDWVNYSWVGTSEEEIYNGWIE